MIRLLCALLLVSPLAAVGVSPEDAARHYLAGEPLQAAPDCADVDEARAWQNAFVAALEPHFGPPIGYKAALTNPQAQKRFGVSEPVLGVLLRDMLTTQNATLPRTPAARPVIEADLVARVGSDAINDAESDLELLNALDAFIPFVELPDLTLATNVPVNGLVLTAINAGARGGVLGEPIQLSGTSDWMKRLAFFTVELRDDSGAVLAEGGGGALLGHPLHSVRWVRDTLRAQQRRLKPGDLVSLGSLTTLLPLDAGKSYTAVYRQLDPGCEVRVQVRAPTNER